MFINSKHDCYNATTIQTDEGVKQARKLYSEIFWCKVDYHGCNHYSDSH